MSRHDVLSIKVLKSAMVQKVHFLVASMLGEPCGWCAEDGDALVVFVGRLAHQKGVDLIAQIIPWIMTPDHLYVTGRAQVLLSRSTPFTCPCPSPPPSPSFDPSKFPVATVHHTFAQPRKDHASMRRAGCRMRQPRKQIKRDRARADTPRCRWC